MEWISLKKQESPLNELVLLANNDSKHVEDHWVVAGERIGKNCYCNQFVDNDIIRPTHWMPLPEPPKTVNS